MIRTNPAARTGRPERRGVTLVEMLVATAMCILGMWMLTWMFQQATNSFTLANAQATLTAQERMVTTVMTRDLEADRFSLDDTFLPRSRGQRVSDYDFRASPGRLPKAGYLLASALPPKANFFEATDTYGFDSARAGGHVLQFTVVRVDEPGNRITAEVPAQSGRTIAGTGLELSYFLVPNGTSSSGAQLYDLMRVQRLVAHNKYDAEDYRKNTVGPAYGPPGSVNDAVHEVMVSSPAYPTAVPTELMYTLEDLAQTTPTFMSKYPPQAAGGPPVPIPPRFNPFPPTPQTTPPTYGGARGSTSKRYGEDRLLSNVLSMEVKFTGPSAQLDTNTFIEPWPESGTYGTPYNAGNKPSGTPTPGSPPVWPRPFDRVNIGGVQYYFENKDYPYDFLPHDGTFDTAEPTGPQAVTPGSPPQTRSTRTPLKITGVQIRLRVLFSTTARQTTIVVAL
jgi:hypothetical protein